MEENKKYGFFDHTADVGMEVLGANIKELFVNSAKGMFEILGDGSKFKMVTVKEVEEKGQDALELLHRWLSTLLYIFDADRLFLTSFEILKIDSNYVKARIGGESFKGKENYLAKEIKAVTYHQMEVKEVENGFKARVIFDI